MQTPAGPSIVRRMAPFLPNLIRGVPISEQLLSVTDLVAVGP